jgi:hypothetical protein
LADKSAASRGLNIPTPVSRREGWGHTEAYCDYCNQRGWTEDYCPDCYDLNHRDEDGDTVTSIPSDPPSPKKTYNSGEDQREQYLAKRAQKRAYYDKHYLPPSQCGIEDLEFDFRPSHSRDDDDSEAPDPTPTVPGVSIYQVTATDPQDFHDEEWGAIEVADEHPYEDYDEGLSDDGEEARLEDKLCETDFRRGD